MVDKETIRRNQRRQRRALAYGEVMAAGRRVSSHARRLGLLRDCASVFAYVADDGEVPTGPLLAEANRLGLPIGLPRVTGQMMSFTLHRGEEDLVAGSWNIPTPNAPENMRVGPTSVVFLPLVAWDRRGNRLGRGGGYYDRAAREWSETTLRVGLAYEFQQVDSLPVDDWDVPLHMVVTERRVVSWVGGSPRELFRTEEADRDGIYMDAARQHRTGGRIRLVGRHAAQAAVGGSGAGD